MKSAAEALSKITDWNIDEIGKYLMETVEENQYHTGKFFMDLRTAITGQKVTPPMNESMCILGKEEVIGRIKKI